MKIMSLDASTKSTGVAIFENKKLIYYDCITASSTDVIKRIQIVISKLNQILQEYKIERIILEEVRPEEGISNIKTQKALMWLQAAINFMLHENHPKIKVEYVYPNSWRAACGIHTGRGRK